MVIIIQLRQINLKEKKKKDLLKKKKTNKINPVCVCVRVYAIKLYICL